MGVFKLIKKVVFVYRNKSYLLAEHLYKNYPDFTKALYLDMEMMIKVKDSQWVYYLKLKRMKF